MVLCLQRGAADAAVDVMPAGGIVRAAAADSFEADAAGTFAAKAAAAGSAVAEDLMGPVLADRLAADAV